MIDRIFTKWTWMRAAYFFIGAWVIVQSVIEGQWIGLFLGVGPAAMGLFSLGCAAGNCTSGYCEVDIKAEPFYLKKDKGNS